MPIEGGNGDQHSERRRIILTEKPLFTHRPGFLYGSFEFSKGCFSLLLRCSGFTVPLFFEKQETCFGYLPR